MLKASWTQRLCQTWYSCQLLRHNISTQVRQTPQHSLSSNISRPSWRQFSQLHANLAQKDHDETDVPNRNDIGQQAPQQDRQDIENAIISVLEKELGMPLEEAMEKDRAAVHTLVEKMSLAEQSQVLFHAAYDPIQELRETGATHEEIVREARNTFGDSLPSGVLEEKEYTIYRRLYGEPSPETDEMAGIINAEAGNDRDQDVPVALYSAEGEEIVYDTTQKNIDDEPRIDIQGFEDASDLGVSPDSAKADLAAHTTPQQAANAPRGQVVDIADELDEDIDGDQDDFTSRAHPMTILGKFATSPRTVFLPADGFVRPVEKLMSGFSNKHLKEMCERTFGGPGLPDSPLTPRSGRFRQQVPIPLEANQSAMGEMEANAFVASVMPPTYASVLSVLVETRKRLGESWLTRLLAKDGGPRVLDVSAGGMGIVAWREIVTAHWEALHSSDRRPPPVPATKSVVLTGSDALRHRAASMLENTTFIPRLPDYVRTRDVPTLEDDRPAQQRKQFDIIIAPHSLLTLKEDWMRKQHVQNLWSLLSSEGGVLILIEKGMPRGFEAIAGAREMLLERYIASPPGYKTQYSRTPDQDSVHKKETAMIVAPCTNHEKCPMYTTPGFSRGRKDICSFQQRYIRPGFLQRILGASDRNHDDVDFSYLSVMKGDDLRNRQIRIWSHIGDPSTAPIQSDMSDSVKPYSPELDEIQAGFENVMPDPKHPISSPQVEIASRPNLPATHQLPRVILPPIKRKGHVTLDICTPAGKIERWTVPRSFSGQAYRDARKSSWGDLWALGAKTRTTRNLSLGTSEKDIASKKKNGEDASAGKGRGRKERLKIKAHKILDEREKDRLVEIEEQDELMRALNEEDMDANVSNGTPARSMAQEGGLNKSDLRRAKPRQDDAAEDSDEVSRILAEWQEEFDQVSSDNKVQTRRLNKLDKRKLKKDLRTMHKGRPLA